MEKAFTDCSLVFLEDTFGLRQVPQQDTLQEWLDMAKTISITPTEKAVIPIFQQLLLTNVASWHEQDLSLHFVGPIFSLIGFTEPYRYNLFAERKIGATIVAPDGNKYHLSGKPDEMIASGFREPVSPYFCFQEFKRETDPNGDPIGQNLAAMLVGQTINQNQSPMYGCYILGRDWYFMTLKNQYYCISKGYDATTEQVFELFKILKTLKKLIDKKV
jgi:hypothetical protein